ncbi:anaerobic ribonucleoside-triphosphate reductase [Clostridium sp. CAG:288]|nr:anaerobic ribonucleoside-triphosphate reductase [Clostridium sp. CAG:288]
MITKITKRDGRIVAFDASKILGALNKAVERSEEDVPLGQLTDEVVSVLNSRFDNKDNKASVEATQDIIEELLIKHNFPKTAKEYITYRAHRNEVREAKTRLMSTIRSITFQDAKDSDVKRENANIDGDTAMGTMLKYGSETAKDFYLSTLIDKDIAKAHISGDIHIHDLDFYTLTLTCCQIDLLKLFHNGFSTGHGFLREPNDIRSYAALACIAIQADQNDMHGGQAVPNFDFSMAEGVRKSFTKIFRNNTIKFSNFIRETESDVDYTESMKAFFKDLVNKNAGPKYLNKESYDQTFNALKESYPEVNFDRIKKDIIKDSELEIKEQTYQAMEALIHNLNTMHSRAGAQVPFSSLNYGTDTSEEGRLVVSCLLDTTIAGLGDGETPIFPIQIFKVKEGVNYNPGDKNYDLFQKAILCSAKRLFPNFSFLDAPFNFKYYKENDYNSEVAYMGCRTRVMANNYDPTKEVTCGRGNLSFTSINLPRLGILYPNKDEFFKHLDEMCDLVIKQLLDRFEVQRHKKVKNMPFLMGQHVWIDSDKLGWDDEIDEVIRNGTLTIGFIGLAECLIALTGKHHGESEESQKLGLEIVGFMRKKMDEASEKYHLNFSLIATPAEGLSGRFVKLDKKRFGIIPGVTDKEFYTNSFHVPVYYPISMFKKIDIEAPYHNLTNGGHITYIEVDGDIAKNPQAFEKIVRHMKEKGIGYGAVNHPVDRDPICGYNGIIDNVCPKCGRHEEEGSVGFERIRRITGYLVGTLDRFNDAKRAEEHARVKHSKYSSQEEK